MPCYNVQHMFITKYSNTLQLPMIWIYGIIIQYTHKNGFLTKWYYMILISKKLIFTNVIHFTLPSAFFQHRCLSRTNYDNEVTIIPVKTQKSNNTLRTQPHVFVQCCYTRRRALEFLSYILCHSIQRSEIEKET